MAASSSRSRLEERVKKERKKDEGRAFFPCEVSSSSGSCLPCLRDCDDVTCPLVLRGVGRLSNAFSYLSTADRQGKGDWERVLDVSTCNICHKVSQ